MWLEVIFTPHLPLYRVCSLCIVRPLYTLIGSAKGLVQQVVSFSTEGRFQLLAESIAGIGIHIFTRRSNGHRTFPNPFHR